MKPQLDFIIKGYKSTRFDRNNERGGRCITFIKGGIPYRCIVTDKEHEGIITELFNGPKET